jgi:hypothetical protein
MSHWDRVIPLLIGAWLLLGPFATQLEANADTERDLFRTWALGAFGEWPDKGPRLDHSPLSIGPGWYLTTAPALLISDGSIFAVHIWHVITFLLGLALLQAVMARWFSRPVALAVALALVTSGFIAQVMVRVWHPAQLPGLALAWFAFMIVAVRSTTPRIRGAALFGGWALLPWMLQLHLVSVSYLGVQLLLSANVVRRDGFTARRWIAASVGTGVLLIAGYIWALSGIDLADVLASSSQRLSGTDSIAQVLFAIPELLTSAWMEPPRWPLAILYLAAIFVGFGVSCRWISRTDEPSRWVLLQVVIGLVVVSVLSRLAAQARYFSALMPGLFVLFGLGLHTLSQVLSERRRWSLPAVVLVASVFGAWFEWPLEDEAAAIADRSSTPTLREQSAIVDYARTHGLAGHRLEAKLHGPVYGGLTALRWIDFSEGITQSQNVLADKELFVAPTGFPGTPPLIDQQVISTGPGRSLLVGTFERRYAAITAEINASCPISFPYRWGALTSIEYREFDILKGGDIERCRSNREAPLTLRVSGARGEPMYLLLAWYDVARNYPERANVTVAGGDVERVQGPMLDHLALYRLYPRSDTLVVQLGPLDTIASIDLY